MSHTPWPWEIEERTKGNIWISGRKGFGWVAQLAPHKSIEVKANTHLIAAAPELWEELIRLTQEYDCPQRTYDLIAKAEGR